MKKDKAPELKLEIKRLRSVDLENVSGGLNNTTNGGYCKAASYCDVPRGSI